MNKIYTIGYGRAKWEDFFKRLVDADIDCVIDIRKIGSRSRNGNSFYWGNNPWGNPYMGDLLSEEMEYFTAPMLAAHTGMPFRAWLDLYTSKLDKVRNIIGEFPDSNICLLCCERDYRRCHRNIVAKAIAKEFGLEIVHL